jgi:hypothetical protein
MASYLHRTSLRCWILLSSVIEPAAVVTIAASRALTPRLPYATGTSALVPTGRSLVVVRVAPASSRLVGGTIVHFCLRNMGTGWRGAT